MDVGQELLFPTLASNPAPTATFSAATMSNGSSVDQSSRVYSPAEAVTASFDSAVLHRFEASAHGSEINNVSEAAVSSQYRGLLPAFGSFDHAALPQVLDSLANPDALLEDGFFGDFDAYEDDTILNAGLSLEDQSLFSSFNNSQWAEGFDASLHTFAPDHFTGTRAPPMSNDAPHAPRSPGLSVAAINTDSCIDLGPFYSQSGPGQSSQPLTGMTAPPTPYDAHHKSISPAISAPAINTNNSIDPELFHSHSCSGRSPQYFTGMTAPRIPYDAQHASGLPDRTAPAIHTDSCIDLALSHSALDQSPSPDLRPREGATAFLGQRLEASPDIRQPDTIFFIVSADLEDHGPHALSYRDQLSRKISGTTLEQYSTLNKEYPPGSHLFLAYSCGCCTAAHSICDGSFPCEPCQSLRIICLPTVEPTKSMISGAHDEPQAESCTTHASGDAKVAPSRRRKRKLPADGEDEAENQSSALLDGTEAQDTKKGAVTRAIKRIRKDGQPSCTDGYRNSIPQAPHLLTRLPGIPCTDEEILTYHPNHVKWPHVAARLIINGWTPPKIARFINEAHGLNGTLDEMKSNTYTKMIANSGLVVYQSSKGKRADGKWTLKMDVSIPDPNDPSAYAPRQKDQENKITDYLLADLLKGVALYPSGEKAGPYTQCIQYAISHPESNYKISDVPRILQTLEAASALLTLQHGEDPSAAMVLLL